MKKTSPAPKKPRSIERIAEAVSNLLVPPLTSLHQTFMEQKAGVNEKRSELLNKREDIRNEGFAAAMRLMSPNADQLQMTKGSYLELVNNQRGNKDE